MFWRKKKKDYIGNFIAISLTEEGLNVAYQGNFDPTSLAMVVGSIMNQELKEKLLMAIARTNKDHYDRVVQLLDTPLVHPIHFFKGMTNGL